MKKLLIALIAVSVFACPALAYEFTYTDGFESGTLGTWTYDGWGTMTVGDATAGYQVRTGTYSLRQGNSTVDRAARDFRLPSCNAWAYQGQADAWVYDDQTFPPQNDMRLGIVDKDSTWTATNSPAGFIVGAVTNTSSGSWGSSVYYCYQWSYTQGKLDGATLPSYANSTFTMSPFRP